MNIFQIILIQPLTNGLIACYEILFHNLGLAIIGFSVILRFILNPLTKPYLNSMKKMKELEPNINKLKEKYKNDKQGLMAAQAELYKQKGVNPGAGCVPYLIQIVILIALFNVFTGVLSSKGDVMARLNSVLYQPLRFPEGQILNTKFLYLDITKPDAFQVGLPFKIPGPLLILAALLQFLTSKMMAPAMVSKAKKEGNQVEDMQTAMQSSMLYTFPLFTIVFGLGFPSGLALYWLLFSLWQLIQQYSTSGWGGLTPWISRLGLLKSTSNEKGNKNR